jgi:hypothetical protein
LILDSGYAYSAAPGHDKLVTDSLTNRLKEALAKKMFSTMHTMDYVKQEDLKSSNHRRNSRSDGSLRSNKSAHTEQHKVTKHWTDVESVDGSDYKDQKASLIGH